MLIRRVFLTGLFVGVAVLAQTEEEINQFVAEHAAEGDALIDKLQQTVSDAETMAAERAAAAEEDYARYLKQMEVLDADVAQQLLDIEETVRQNGEQADAVMEEIMTEVAQNTAGLADMA